jgi:hypothetical protein
MPYEREGYAPWSLTREAGVQSATVDGTVKVPQYVQPTLSTGFVDEKGNWQGSKSSDEVFIAFDTHLGIPNTGEILTPQAVSDNKWPIDMTGFNDIQIAIKPTNGGVCKIEAVMGPDTNSYANLRPVNPASPLRGNNTGVTPTQMDNLLIDASDNLTANVWNIFYIKDQLKNQKLLQFRITNNSGGESDIEIAFMRLV